jgi:hypothetical protein
MHYGYDYRFLGGIVKAFISVLLLMAMHRICAARVVHVPSDEPTVQAGINAAMCSSEVTVPATSMGMGIKIVERI